MFPCLETEKLVAHYDATKQIACVVIFDKVFNVKVFPNIYRWIDELSGDGYEVKAILMDCCHIHSFPREDSKIEDNLQSVQTIESDASTLPLVIVVKTAYHEQKLSAYLKQFEQVAVDMYVQDYITAFNHISTFHKWQDVPIGEHDLSTNVASLRVDSAAQYTYITYYGVVTAQATVDVYEQMIGNIASMGVENVKAGIFDFRHVTRFDNSNMGTVQRSSGKINRSYDMSRIAVSLVVGNFHQDRMVHVAMKVSPDEERKKIVYSENEAYTFIEEFHAKINAKGATGT